MASGPARWSIRKNLGAGAYIYVDIGAEEPINIRQEGNSTLVPGDKITFGPKGDRFHRFDKEGRPMVHSNAGSIHRAVRRRSILWVVST